MKARLALILAVACPAAAAAAPRAPDFEASGTAPGWTVLVEDSSIILGLGPDGVPAGVTGQAYLTGGLRKREENGVLIWEAGSDAILVVVEARPGHCTDPTGTVRPYRVTVRTKDRTLEGCGSVPAPRKDRR